MAEYKNDNPCEFIYHITAIEKVVDGDTIMQLLIWGSMLGIVDESVCWESIHQNQELVIWQKSFMESSPRPPLSHGYIGQLCRTEMILKFKSDVQRKTVEVNSEEFLENFGSTALPMEKNFRAGPI